MASAAGAGSAEQAVLGSSEPLPADTPLVRGYVFPPRDAPGGAPPPVDYAALLEAMATTGFQATNFGAAVTELNRMIAWRLSDEPVPADASPEEADPAYRAKTRCKARTRRLTAQQPARRVGNALFLATGADGSGLLRLSRRFSWASRPTSSPPACARACATWCSTAWLTCLSPRPAASKKT